MTAFGFLTTLPIGGSDRLSEADLARAAAWFPWVGLMLGAFLAAGWQLLSWRSPNLSAAALLLLLWIVASGALHLDGLADCCDGLLAPTLPARRLEIMRDSRSGAFAVVGIVMMLLLKVSAVASLNEPTALLLAPLYGRWWMLPLGLGRQARPTGLAATLGARLSGRSLVIPAALTLLFTWFAGVTAFIALVGSGLTTLGLFRFARARIGGVTGDVLGANCELAEVVTLIVFVLMEGVR